MSQNGEEEAIYNNSHRAFLQSFISHATLTFEQAKPILAAIFSAQYGREIQANDITEEDMTTYINELNTAISPFDLDIRSTNTQTSPPTRLYALVNTTSDAITQLATTHTADEIAFVKRLLDAMFETNNTHRSEVMAVSATAALRLAKAQEGEQVASLTMMQAQRCLGALVEEGWLLCSRREFYSLSARALMELRGWLEEAYNDEEEEVVKVRVCHACREIVTVGERCPDLTCPCRLHNHCKRNAFRIEGNNHRCPICKKDWDDALPVGEKAALENRRSTGVGLVTARRSTVNDGADESQEGSEEDED